MIHYQLRCAGGEGFDGWFKEHAPFEAQAKARFVESPTCGGTDGGKGLLAPAIPKKGARSRRGDNAPVAEEPARPDTPARPPVPAPGGPDGGMVAGPIPAQLVAMLQRMRSEVERNCEYVGPKFAEAARKLHERQQRGGPPAEGTATPPLRGIYGEATDAEAEALREDGIEVARIPWVPRADG